MEIPSTYRPQESLPRSVYVHIPFCRHRCGYCNFALVANRDYLIDRYLDALAIEIGWLDRRYRLETLFLGGGTPTHITARQFERLFSILSQHFDFENAEVTSEANPSDLNLDKIKLLTDLGVNRFSLGVQSFRKNKLQFLERDHDHRTVEQVVSGIRRFTSNFSIDLIFATMGETLAQWQDELKSAVELGPTHLSTYELTIEKGTAFWNRHAAGEIHEVEEDLRTDMFLHSIGFLHSNGLEQYEISSFAAPGHSCQHNLVYWNGNPYFAFGAGASRLVDGIRETNRRSVKSYINKIENSESPVAETEKLGPVDQALEMFVIGLRRTEGVQFNEVLKLSGVDVPSLIREQLELLSRSNLISSDSGGAKLTPKGLLLYDSIVVELLSANNDVKN